MDFIETALDGAWLLKLEKRGDDRGFFARAFCTAEFEAHGIDFKVVQANLARTQRQGTFRGLHYQSAAAPEGKLIRCIRGSMYDVMVDMRPGSPTYLKSFGVELSADNHMAVYVPPLFAHGYQALSDEMETLYMVSHAYAPDHELGLRYDDPAISVTLPLAIAEISDKDKAWPDITV